MIFFDASSEAPAGRSFCGLCLLGLPVVDARHGPGGRQTISSARATSFPSRFAISGRWNTISNGSVCRTPAGFDSPSRRYSRHRPVHGRSRGGAQAPSARRLSPGAGGHHRCRRIPADLRSRCGGGSGSVSLPGRPDGGKSGCPGRGPDGTRRARRGQHYQRRGPGIESGDDGLHDPGAPPGDIITIQEADPTAVAEEAVNYFYAYGEVKNPGSYEFRRGLTIEKAIVLAGGFTPRASKRKISIRRRKRGGSIG